MIYKVLRVDTYLPLMLLLPLSKNHVISLYHPLHSVTVVCFLKNKLCHKVKSQTLFVTMKLWIYVTVLLLMTTIWTRVYTASISQSDGDQDDSEVEIIEESEIQFDTGILQKIKS